MGVRLPAREQVIELSFWSKSVGAFDQRDLPLARRIADYVALSVSHEQLVEAERQAAEAQARAERLEARVQLLSEELESKTQIRVVGESTEWREVLKKATQVAETDTTVLVTGESGTGKEVVARFIHRASARSRGPFVALNCAALPEQLLESELFGYERGAFTSAQQAKPGQIELAAGGVLFLDEVTEMSLAAQAKFLRVLQEREFQRLGGTRMLKANIRVIAATNRDLRKAVERGDFREDLFYRLQVFDIEIPPLRERAADILPLSEALLQDIGKSFGRPPAGLTRDAREALLRYHWPGNVRELRNALERAAILCEGGLFVKEGSLAVRGQVTLGALTVFTQAAAQLQGAFQGLLGGVQGIYEHGLYSRRCMSCSTSSHRIRAPEHPAPVRRPLRQGIEFRNVSFRYPARGAGAGRRLLHDCAGGDGGTGRPQRRGQIDAGQAARPPLRPDGAQS